MRLQEKETDLIPKQIIINTDSLESIRKSVSNLSEGVYELRGATGVLDNYIAKIKLLFKIEIEGKEPYNVDMWVQKIKKDSKGLWFVCKRVYPDPRSGYRTNRVDENKILADNPKLSFGSSKSHTMSIYKIS